jgi:hypothetical protein
MRKFIKILVLIFLLVFITSSLSHGQVLIDYVNKPDDSYSWRILSEVNKARYNHLQCGTCLSKVEGYYLDT